MIVSRHPPF